MRIIKSLLIVLFAAVLVLYCFSEYRTRTSKTDEGPVLSCPTEPLEVSVKATDVELLAGITATDSLDGDITGEVMVSGVSKLLPDNTAKVTYIVFDSHDNMATATRRIKYTDYSRPTISIVRPLVFATDGATGIVDCFKATDVLDGDISSSIRVSSLIPTSDSSVYYITVQVMNSLGDNAKVKVPVSVTSDSSLPTVSLSSYLVYVPVGGQLDKASYLQSARAGATELPLSSVVISGEVDTAKPGTYYVKYECTSNNKTGASVLTVVVR